MLSLKHDQLEINAILFVFLLATYVAYQCFQNRQLLLQRIDKCMTATKDTLHPKRTVTVSRRTRHKYVRIQEKDENDETHIYTPAEAQELIVDTMFPSSPIPIPPPRQNTLENRTIQYYPFHLLPSTKKIEATKPPLHPLHSSDDENNSRQKMYSIFGIEESSLSETKMSMNV